MKVTPNGRMTPRPVWWRTLRRRQRPMSFAHNHGRRGAHRRSLRFRTAGFTYDEAQDHWECPEGEHLWPHEFDHERRLVRYRAKAHICNGCPRKAACTDSDRGREIVRPSDPWPHSEAGRFHRAISLLMVALARADPRRRSGAPPRAVRSRAAARADSRRRARRALAPARPPRPPANFPTTPAAHGLVATGADGRRPRSRWTSQNRTEA